MEYFGEHLLPGQLGHFFVLLSFISSLISGFAYYQSAKSISIIQQNDWKKLARIAFYMQSFSILAVLGLLFYIINQHYFEYKYAWQHTSKTLEVKYRFAAFWEGQEGSFLLWSFWQSVLGFVLIKTAKEWESKTMITICLAQFCIAGMLVGFYFSGIKMGSDPFILLRLSGVLDNAPAFHDNFDVTQAYRKDYLSLIKDGNDLNILLQNYWMVIHPPVLFLGFASTIVPFAYAFAGLFSKNFSSWINKALPWGLFSIAVLGTGIMMGAAWAYESLNFGGYWAWDPVENASLVPWLVMVAGVHTVLIYKSTGQALRATYLFFITSFGLVLYSTYLTRSGILGDTSVHAFTQNDTTWQLLLLLALFLIPAFVLFFINLPNIPNKKTEEKMNSREFWMYVGALIIFLAAIVIIVQTSLPLINKIFKNKMAAQEDAEFTYNKIQIYIAILLGLLTGITQYFRYKQTEITLLTKRLIWPIITTVIISILTLFIITVNFYKHGPAFASAIWMAVVAAIFSIVANGMFIWKGLNGKLKLSGGSIAHVGFGLILLGILLSSAKKETLSLNNGILMNFGKESKENPGENLTLIKGLKTDMGKYWVTYTLDSVHPLKPKWYYKIDFEKKEGNEKFTLWPDAFVNYKMEGLQSNPDSKHFLTHDIFVYITSLPDNKNEQDTASFITKKTNQGDTIFYSQGFMIVKKIEDQKNLPVEIFGSTGTLQLLPIQVFAKTGSVYTITPKLATIKNTALALPDTLIAENLILQFQKVNSDKSVNIGIKELKAPLKFVTLKVYAFPYIFILWLGIFILVIGTLISMIRRWKLSKNNLEKI